MSRLAEIAAAIGARPVGATAGPAVGDDVIDDVVADSRQARPGALFCCVVGSSFDGHDFAAAAVRDGASALLCERALDLDVPQLVVDDVRVAMAPAAALVHGSPSQQLDVIGVTGTNGKTTVISMIAAVMDAAGRPCRTIGTLTGARTTPEAPDLQRQLAADLAEGIEVVAMEVSSHALALHRVDALHFGVGVFTNLGVDHLDFHLTQEAYFAAKASLFEPGRCDVGIVNVDDVHGRLLVDAGGDELRRVSLSDAHDLIRTRRGSEFVWRDRTISLTMPGTHNVMDALLAAEACRAVGVDDATIAVGLSAVPVVPGRFEVVGGDDDPLVVVDFAHTPDALEQVLDTARELLGGDGRLIVVFGCGGDRDAGKRPQMGEVACRLADSVIVTSDNPRSEDPGAIIDAILAGCAGTTTPTVEPDRRAAIRSAVAAAGPDDVVIVAGKGHEQGQIVGDRVLPFDDRVVVQDVLDSLAGGVR